MNTNNTVAEILATAPNKAEESTHLDKMRVRTCGPFTLTIIPKADKVASAGITWRGSCTVEGRLSFKNDTDTIKQREFVLHVCQSKTIKNLYRSIFSKAWSSMYQYAVMMNAVEFQITYLKYRIKKAAGYVNHHAELFTQHGRARDRQYVIDNAEVEKRLKKRLAELENTVNK